MRFIHLNKQKLNLKKKISEKEKIYTEQHKENYAEKMERCVLCGELTDVPVMQPVGERKCYIVGAGQLCRKCCIELYGTDNLNNSAESEICKI